ncbi:type II toxin-antitoxin system prevent-host-death family antitoxin [Candidatus Dojkabacteria bacterium]|nr:type II toxin-antitoxin system prevent-host-death family antitoxin [Candidatus Dojkabacteria bacterium]
MQKQNKKKTQVLTVSRTDARQNLPSLLDKVQQTGGPVYINERGENQAVIISFQEYEQFYNKDFADNPMFGMWKHRKNLTDSINWVNKNRKSAERKV